MSKEVVILSAVRTPIGSLGGALRTLGAVDLGVIAAREAVSRAGIDPSDVEQMIIGNVLSAAQGQNIARQVQLGAGIPQAATALSVNMVCGSGLRAVSLAAALISTGEADIILAGGTESMSNAPHAVPSSRFGQRMGHAQMIDTMISDGLWDAFYDCHMGITAENLAEQYHITREEQDAFALQSQNRAEAAIKAGRLKDEIVPVFVPQRKGDPVKVDTDEYPRFGAKPEHLSKLKPAFLKGGTVTAGNASGINDGAAMLVLMSKEKAAALGITPLATIKSYASAGVDPRIMGYGVVPACEKAMQLAGVTAADLDLAEANEAFAVQALVAMRALGLSADKTNVNGGAIALGHPIGCSGARILVTLLHEMQKRNSALGLAGLCIGGGMGTALLVERT